MSEPTQNLTWLGCGIDLEKYILFIKQERVQSLKEEIHRLLESMPYTTARKLAKVAGIIISTKLVLGNITRLKTRRLYKEIMKAKTWDGRIKLEEFRVIEEIIFWKFNFDTLNVRYLKEYNVPFILAASDASKSGMASHIISKENIIAYGNFSEEEEKTSSTERELLAVQAGVQAFLPKLQGKKVIWQTSNS